MIRPRRLSLQLTPLFDLMLIVIFAQYLSVRTDQAETAKLSQEWLEQRLAAEADLQQAQARQQTLGELLVELFDIPAEEVANILQLAEGRSEADRAQLAARFEELAEQNSQAAIQQVLTYGEIRKRCDVWNLHLDAAGVITLQINDESPTPVLDIATEGLTLNRLGFELFAKYKTIPDQKSLVLILVTYDRGTRIQLKRQLLEILPQITAEMQADAGGRSRYDYSDMGFRSI